MSLQSTLVLKLVWYTIFRLPNYKVHTTLISANKVDANGTIQVGFGGITQNVVGAKLYEHRDNVAILELVKRIDFTKPACLGKPSQDTFVLTGVSNDRLAITNIIFLESYNIKYLIVLCSIHIKDGESAKGGKCSSRRKNERCIKILGGFPCTTILGGN